MIPKFSHLVIIILILLGFGIGCTESTESLNPGTIQACAWGGAITNAKAADVLRNWQNKWDFPSESNHSTNETIPDSFFVNRSALDGLIKNKCGFRAYFALTRPGDITSLGLVITAINDHYTDLIGRQEDKILFANVTTKESMKLNEATGKEEFPTTFITLELAKKYNSNWRHYNQICLENVVLGNSVCKSSEINRIIDPRGSLGKEVKQVVPLGLAFSTLKLNEFMAEKYPNASTYILYNCMYPLEENHNNSEGGKIDGFRYDLFVRGFIPERFISNSKTSIKTARNPNAMEAFNISGGCPFLCNDQDELQRDDCC